jgi:hypothetical protein
MCDMRMFFDRLPRRTLLTCLAATLAFRKMGWAQHGSDLTAIEVWRKVRDALVAEGGEVYFAEIEGVLIPPVGMFDGTVVAQSSLRDLIVNVDNAAGDATLDFEQPQKSIIPGTPIRFRGVVKSYQKDPYMLTVWLYDGDVRLADSK